MTMISCPKCHKQISDQASACRHCGAARGEKRSAPGSGGGFALHLVFSTMTAIIGTILYIGGQKGGIQSEILVQLAPYLLVGGCLWYVVARIWSSVSKF